MDAPACRLLCVDLQVDAAIGLEPDPSAIFGARQLLALGRRLGWTIAHARRRSRAFVRVRDGTQFGGLNPLMSEKVFIHDGRSIADSVGLADLLHSWRHETVFVAAFDHVALLSCLLTCYEPGPRLVLVEDVLSLQSLTEESSVDAFRRTASHLAAGATSISGIIAEANRRLGLPAPLISGPVGEAARNMPV